MNLYTKLLACEEKGSRIRVGLIGAGKFGTMFVSQALRTPGLHLVAVADLSPGRARAAIIGTGWAAERIEPSGIEDAAETGRTALVEDATTVVTSAFVDIVVEATGSPDAGIDHALACFAHGKHVLMVNVEADALAGPALAKLAEEAGVIYSLAYGDQPALICEMVDWARASGLKVVAAGKGTKHRQSYHESTPKTVWDHYGLTPEEAQAGGLNPKMFNSFLDGTKSAIEMAAVANATGLDAPEDGLGFHPCGTDALPSLLCPEADGGVLPRSGLVEVISSVDADGNDLPNHLRWGVFTVFEAPSDYVARCFREYGLATDATGRFAAMYKPFHLIGLELGISVASIALRGEPTGTPTGFRADAVSVAKRDLAEGEPLDGEGGHCVWGKLTTAGNSLAKGYLPIGVASGCRMRRPVAQGEVLRWDDVIFGDDQPAAVSLRSRLKPTAA